MSSGRYGLLYPSYWDGPTGLRIARTGGKDALLLGAFLLSNHRANMIGLYRLPTNEIGLPLALGEIVRAFDALEAADFASYDDASAIVWVHEMARYRLGLATRTAVLAKNDKRLIHVDRIYKNVPDNPFLDPFYLRYRRALHLKTKRLHGEAPSKPLASPFEASNRDQRSVTGTGTEDRSDRSGGFAPDFSTGFSTGHNDPATEPTPHGNYDVIEKLAYAVLRAIESPSVPDATEALKVACASKHIAYDGSTVARALDSVAHKLGIEWVTLK